MDKPAYSPAEINQQGQALFAAGKFDEAARTFQEASRGFSQAGNALMAAEAANNSSVAFLKSGDAAKALGTAGETDIVFEQAGDTYRQALALGNQAAAYEALGNLQEALIRYRRSSELLKNDEHREARAFVLQSLSSLQMRMGNQMEAMVSMTAALENKPNLGIRERLLKKLLRLPFKMLGSKE